ncbi:hypothetical protein RIVM261_013390 [Rivularia sp. IAM M-261]|nr:hypothetical protein RIVM261_013390 [Rivularia sp. IAM M-261]
MSVITIQCRLVANDQTLRHLWELMAEKNTPLISELLEQMGKHPDFETWLTKGEVPKDTIKTLCDSLKAQNRFAGQPGRFYTSTVSQVKEIYKSWLALQKRRQRQIEGKQRWLRMLKSDVELQEESNCSLETIRVKATEILAEFVSKFTKDTNQKSKKKTKSTKNTTQKPKKKTKKDTDESGSTLFQALFDIYDKTEDTLSRCAIIYLLKNHCQVNEIEEDPDKFLKSKRAKEIEIERLQEQIVGRIPKGRDLTNKKWLDTIKLASSQVPQDENEAKSWQNLLLKTSSSVPYSVDYETNTDIKWTKDNKGRLFVNFNGLGDHKFEVYCDSRQLPYFQRFCEDLQIWHDDEEKYSSALFMLRSARLVWLEKKGRGKPWNIHRLYLHCSLDTSLWTAEGTEQIRTNKINEADKVLTKAKTKDKKKLNENQLAYLQRQQSTRNKLNNPFPGRPSKPIYQGNSHILVGVSLGLEKPTTVAVVDVASNKVLAYRSVQQLLGQNYKLLNRQRQQQQHLAKKRHESQKKQAPNQFGESELGQYVDRLLAKSIITLATTYQASSIVLPKLRDMREIIQSEIQAKAEKKIPGYKEGQQQYAKQYRISIHRWSYGRLIENIQSQAAKAGISVETTSQQTRGSPQEQAKDLVIFAYRERQAISNK